MMKVCRVSCDCQGYCKARINPWSYVRTADPAIIKEAISNVHCAVAHDLRSIGRAKGVDPENRKHMLGFADRISYMDYGGALDHYKANKFTKVMADTVMDNRSHYHDVHAMFHKYRIAEEEKARKAAQTASITKTEYEATLHPGTREHFVHHGYHMRVLGHAFNDARRNGKPDKEVMDIHRDYMHHYNTMTRHYDYRNTKTFPMHSFHSIHDHIFHIPLSTNDGLKNQIGDFYDKNANK